MFVVATAGHVDHGKSTLVRALTGMEPDRWAEERRRGLTIDLGFAWTALPSGRRVAFVDVPGHERFFPNTLAGLGPATVVCFVVAADEGWCAQSSDHRDAIAALGISHAVVALTRADRATSERVAEVSAQVRAKLAHTGIHNAPIVAVSAAQGSGLDTLRAVLDKLLAGIPAPSEDERVRLWVDRSFSITGAGTVVTGTLTAGTLAVGEHLLLLCRGQPRPVAIRGLQSCGEPHPALGPTARVAVNLRGVASGEVRRGDVLVRPDEWLTTAVADVRHAAGRPLAEAPEQLVVHVGTAATPARLRRLDAGHARLSLACALPLTFSDRLLVRDPGAGRVLGGVWVLDPDPPALRRRGAAARRAEELAGADPTDRSRWVLAEVARRGAVSERRLRLLGYQLTSPPPQVTVIRGWWVHAPTYRSWRDRLRCAVRELRERDPLSAGLSRGAAVDLLALPGPELLDELVGHAGLIQRDGLIGLPDDPGDLGPAEAAIADLESRLAASPFHAPEADDLAALGLGVRELAAAARLGRLLRLNDNLVLLPSAPALAMRELARLRQPFTATQAKQALNTTRRVVIPLLEYLDSRGWTRRLDAVHREVVR
ncbi:selenocysteine-specific translation elongation factor [Mycolicibacter hiberniae]|uniref:Selenocysteine-specific translation elongation factor n=1 Tax=Mycolicibacter hiberniae TaxID=29314 RepID=A0A7I7X6J9_9MYCO|nr:selenocysteine-specific translation elongation factor [Mycolicibacter hiberniae]MCV7087641.1 selenocysteine-specific translation elongation factor [Mycolicibacter hiberniae]ORV72278.1 translation elongation factor [Mycolicibacter hiberniae]BBZ24835.1 selenocysteine-specific translation elongation factor [Mycolicibacter hiberniae]